MAEAGPVAASPVEGRSSAVGRRTRSREAVVEVAAVAQDVYQPARGASVPAEFAAETVAAAVSATPAIEPDSLSASGPGIAGAEPHSGTETDAMRDGEFTAAPVPSPESLWSEIAQLAYYLWLEGGCRHGRDHEDWAEAERQVLSRYTVR